MLKYYIKLAASNFRSNKLVFFGSIASICLGAISISFIYSFVYNELTMNKFHERQQDIYMLTVKVSPVSAIEPINATGLLNFNYKAYPELENLTGITKFREGEIKVTKGETSFLPEVLIADSAFFNVFSFKLLLGDPKTALSDRNAVLLTETYAGKLFGTQNPMGQTLKVSTNHDRLYTVKAVLKDVPSNSSIKFEMVLPAIADNFQRGNAEFVLAKKGFNHAAFNQKIEKLGRVIPGFDESKISVINLRDIYYNKDNFNAIMDIFFSHFGDKKNIYVLHIIMLIILIISALNLANMQVIQVNGKVKYLGISKIMGAGWKNLMVQKVTEFAIIVIVSALACSIIYILLLPGFNKLILGNLAPSVGAIVLINLFIPLLMILLSMAYPFVLTARLSVSGGMKEHFLVINKYLSRKAIVAFQFGLTILLLISSLVVIKQLHMMLNKNIGFTSKDIVNVKMIQRVPYIDNQEELNRLLKARDKNYLYIKSELASNPFITSFTQGGSPIKVGVMPMKVKGSPDDFKSCNCLPVTASYLKLFDMQMAEGRFFDENLDAGSTDKIIINETAKRNLGIGDISQTRILNMDPRNKKGYEIIGVVKDYNYEHLAVVPQPMFMFDMNNVEMDFIIRFSKGATEEGLQAVRQLFEKVNPGQVFSFTFLSDDIAALYQKEKRTSLIYMLFTFISLLISSLGLFTIACYETQVRTKEIGIRKVNGAKVTEILSMLNRDFVKWVAVAFVIATPIAWYAMNKWLESFAYKTSLSWWIFALAGLLALGIALLTVSWQSWKAATRNPVEALRYE